MAKGKPCKACIIFAILILLMVAFIFFRQLSVQNKAYKKVAIGKPFELKVGEEAIIDEEKIILKFESVTSDSRCPKGAQCIWAGKVSVFLEITKDSKSHSFELTIEPGNESSAKKAFEGLEVKILEVRPYPEAGKTISKSEYYASFLISKIN